MGLWSLYCCNIKSVTYYNEYWIIFATIFFFQIDKSNNHEVFLRNATTELDGIFKCVVSVEGTFQTFEDTKELTVVGKP